MRSVTPAVVRIDSARADCDDQFLLRRARAGDRAAFTLVADRHRPSAEAFAARLVTTGSAAELVSRAVDHLEVAFGEAEEPLAPFRPLLLAEVRRHRRGIGGQADDAVASSQWIAARTVHQRLPVAQQALLWHSVVEKEDPATVALHSGVAADEVGEAVAACHRQLRDDYLQDHLDRAVGPDCRRSMVAGAADGPVGVPSHVHRAECEGCRRLVRDLTMIEHRLDWVLGAVVLGAHSLLYLRATSPDPAPATDAAPVLAEVPAPVNEPVSAPSEPPGAVVEPTRRRAAFLAPLALGTAAVHPLVVRPDTVPTSIPSVAGTPEVTAVVPHVVGTEPRRQHAAVAATRRHRRAALATAAALVVGLGAWSQLLGDSETTQARPTAAGERAVGVQTVLSEQVRLGHQTMMVSRPLGTRSARHTPPDGARGSSSGSAGDAGNAAPRAVERRAARASSTPTDAAAPGPEVSVQEAPTPSVAEPRVGRGRAPAHAARPGPPDKAKASRTALRRARGGR